MTVSPTADKVNRFYLFKYQNKVSNSLQLQPSPWIIPTAAVS